MVCAYVQVLAKLGIGKAFGELAILYNCKRTASVRALTNGEVWMIDRDVFQQVRLKIARIFQLLRVLPMSTTCPLWTCYSHALAYLFHEDVIIDCDYPV